MKVNIYTNMNGVGLEADALILKEALKGHEAEILCWTKGRRGVRGVLRIHLEHIRKEYLPDNLLNVLIPNPEWFDNRFKKLLKRIDCVLCKTWNGVEIFSALHHDVRYLGFTSFDRFKQVEKKREFVHLAGKSSHKHTPLIAGLWKHMNGHRLTLQKLEKVTVCNYKADNYTFISKRIDDISAFLSSFHFHICPSRAEGFGHYINEALSVGGIVITTNAPPMNELVRDDYGVLVSAAFTGLHNLGREYAITPAGLIEAVGRCANMGDDEIAERSQKARQAFIDRDIDFRNNLNNFMRCITM